MNCSVKFFDPTLTWAKAGAAASNRVKPPATMERRMRMGNLRGTTMGEAAILALMGAGVKSMLLREARVAEGVRGLRRLAQDAVVCGGRGRETAQEQRVADVRESGSAGDRQERFGERLRIVGGKGRRADQGRNWRRRCRGHHV